MTFSHLQDRTLLWARSCPVRSPEVLFNLSNSVMNGQPKKTSWISQKSEGGLRAGSSFEKNPGQAKMGPRPEELQAIWRKSLCRLQWLSFSICEQDNDYLGLNEFNFTGCVFVSIGQIFTKKWKSVKCYLPETVLPFLFISELVDEDIYLWNHWFHNWYMCISSKYVNGWEKKKRKMTLNKDC